MLVAGRSRVVLSAVIASLALAASAQAAGPPPPPKAAGGQAVTVAGVGIPTPTAFAFSGTTVFAGSGPDESKKAQGGLFVLGAPGTPATRLPDSPPVVFGLAWHAGALYVSTGPKIVAYRGWNGTAFTGTKTIYSGKKGFAGFNGLAFGPDGRLYAGLTLSAKYDHTQNPNPLSQAVVSMTASGKGLKILARGLRQPFQLVFPSGASHPYVTVLSEDQGKVPDDEIIVAKAGQDYGFPRCAFFKLTDCKGSARPLVLLPRHASPMGIGAIGKTLYVSLFGGIGKGGPEVVTIPTAGGTPKPFLTGFAAPVIGLGIDHGTVYVGDLTGTIYSVPAA